MLSLKAVQTYIIPTYGLFNDKEFLQKTRFVLPHCKSNNSDEQSPPPPPPAEGDSRKQELLARIAMLQTQKVRLTDYLDERSAYLTQFAEDANAEIDQIGENALRELDEAGARIMENIESKMQAFEEFMELNKLEIEENEKKVADFEGQVEKDRNEGLFFKNLRENAPVDKAKAREEAEKIKDITKKSAGLIMRRNIYLGLIGLVAVGIVDASISSTSDGRKVAVLVVILVGLLSQIICFESKNHDNILHPVLQCAFFSHTDYQNNFRRYPMHLRLVLFQGSHTICFYWIEDSRLPARQQGAGYNSTRKTITMLLSISWSMQ